MNTILNMIYIFICEEEMIFSTNTVYWLYVKKFRLYKTHWQPIFRKNESWLNIAFRIPLLSNMRFVYFCAPRFYPITESSLSVVYWLFQPRYLSLQVYPDWMHQVNFIINSIKNVLYSIRSSFVHFKLFQFNIKRIISHIK